MNKWPMVRIADEFNLQMGKTPARDNPAYWGGDQNWAAIADIARSGMYLSKTKETISQAAVDESGIKEVPPDTIVMSFKLSIGRTAITTSRIYTNEAVMAFLPRDAGAFDLHFLYHLFANRDWSEESNKAVKGITLNKATLKAARIPRPDILEQRTISAILDKLCGLIEKCDEQLERLNQLVKSRFVEMFGNGGKWSSERMNDLCDLITDGEHATPRRVEKGILLLSARNVHDHELKIDEVDYIDQAEYDRIAKRVVPMEGDVLLSCSGSVGRCCVVPKGMRFQMVRSVALLRFKNMVLPKFAEYLICSPYVQRQIDKHKTASSQANLFQGKIRQLEGFVPPLALQREFAAFVAKVDKLAFAVRQRRDLARKMYRAKIQEYFG